MWYYDAKKGKTLAMVGKKKAEYTFSAAVNPNRYVFKGKRGIRKYCLASHPLLLPPVFLPPSLPPNSADKVFRTQQISKWKGAKPDPKQKPKTAGEAARKAMSYYQMLQCEDG